MKILRFKIPFHFIINKAINIESLMRTIILKHDLKSQYHEKLVQHDKQVLNVLFHKTSLYIL